MMTAEMLDGLAERGEEPPQEMTSCEHYYFLTVMLLERTAGLGWITPEQLKRELKRARSALGHGQLWDEIGRERERVLLRTGTLRSRINKEGGCPLCRELVRVMDGRDRREGGKTDGAGAAAGRRFIRDKETGRMRLLEEGEK